MRAAKQTYCAPAVLRIGTFEDITQGNSVGTVLDAAIPAGTPVTAIPAFMASHLS